MFERFTESSRAVLVEAQDLSLELRSGHIGLGHLVYGCAEVRDETAAVPLRAAGISAASIRPLLARGVEEEALPLDPEALRAIGVDYDKVAGAVAATFGDGALESAPDRSASRSGRRKPPFTPAAKKSLEQALRAAVTRGDKRIRPGHLLLGILAVDDEFVHAVIGLGTASQGDLEAAVERALAQPAA